MYVARDSQGRVNHRLGVDLRWAVVLGEGVLERTIAYSLSSLVSCAIVARCSAVRRAVSIIERCWSQLRVHQRFETSLQVDAVQNLLEC